MKLSSPPESWATWPMLAALGYFTLGRLAFSFLQQRSGRAMPFPIIELFAAFMFATIARHVLFPLISPLREILVIALFVASAIGPLLALRRDGVRLPIIDACWHAGLAAGCGSAVGAGSLQLLHGPIEAGQTAAYYQEILETLRYVFDASINGIVTVAATLAACQAIIWAGEVWRARGDSEELRQSHYRSTTVSALRMAFAGVWTAVGIIVFVTYPIVVRITDVTELLRGAK